MGIGHGYVAEMELSRFMVVGRDERAVLFEGLEGNASWQ
jgi:hypothetical protein